MAQIDDELTALGNQVKANTDAEAAAVTIINGIAGKIAAAVATATAAGATPAQLQAVTDLGTALKTSADALAAAEVANTASA